MDQILGPPKARATTIYLTVDPFGLSRKVTTTILTDAPERRLGAVRVASKVGPFGECDIQLRAAYC